MATRTFQYIKGGKLCLQNNAQDRIPVSPTSRAPEAPSPKPPKYPAPRPTASVDDLVVALFKEMVQAVKSGKRSVIHNFMTGIGFNLTFTEEQFQGTMYTRYFRKNHTGISSDGCNQAEIIPADSSQKKYGITGMKFASTNLKDISWRGNLSTSFIDVIKRGIITLLPSTKESDKIETALQIANAWRQTSSAWRQTSSKSYNDLMRIKFQREEKEFNGKKTRIVEGINKKIQALTEFNQKLSTHTHGYLKLNIDELTREQTAISELRLQPGRKYTTALAALKIRSTKLLATIDQVMEDCGNLVPKQFGTFTWENNTKFQHVEKLVKTLDGGVDRPVLYRVPLKTEDWNDRLELSKEFYDLQQGYEKLNSECLQLSRNCIALNIPDHHNFLNKVMTGKSTVAELQRELTVAELQGELIVLQDKLSKASVQVTTDAGMFIKGISPLSELLNDTSAQITISVEELLTQEGVDRTKRKVLKAVWENMSGSVSELNEKIRKYNKRYSDILERIENRFNLKISSLIEGSGVLEAITFDQSATDELKIRSYKWAEENLKKYKQLLEHIEKWLSLSTVNPQGWLEIVTKKYPTKYPRLSTNFLSALEKIKTYTSKVQGYIDSKKKSSRSHFMSHKQKETKINAARKLIDLTIMGKAKFKPSELSALNEGKLHSVKEMLNEGVKREIVIQQLIEYQKTRNSEGKYHYFGGFFQDKSCSRGMKVKAAELLLLFTQFRNNRTEKALQCLKDFMIENKQYEVEIQKALQGGRLKNIKEDLLSFEKISGKSLLEKIHASSVPIKISALTQEGPGQQKTLLQLISNDNRWKDIEDPKINSNRGPGI